MCYAPRCFERSPAVVPSNRPNMIPSRPSVPTSRPSSSAPAMLVPIRCATVALASPCFRNSSSPSSGTPKRFATPAVATPRTSDSMSASVTPARKAISIRLMRPALGWSPDTTPPDLVAQTSIFHVALFDMNPVCARSEVVTPHNRVCANQDRHPQDHPRPPSHSPTRPSVKLSFSKMDSQYPTITY